MNWSNAFYFFELDQALALLLLGAVIGFFLIGDTPTVQLSGWPTVQAFLLLIMMTMYIFMISFRAYSNLQNWERTIGTGALSIVYVLGMGVGIYLKQRRKWKR